MTCWSCGGRTATFYKLGGVPTGSCVLLTDAAAARNYPRGEISLSWCATCGLVQNDAFAEELVDYTSGYEASQAFSPTFRAFADELVAGLTARYDLVDATVFEPGCGDGSFLQLLVERTGGRGIGFDPAHVDGRLDEALVASGRLTIRKELLTPTTRLEADLIVCRHTLEHIRDLSGFMQGVANVARRGPGTVVVFEVPEAGRIFREGAFWDVYYEHATYFTRLSLARLFRAHGLSPRRVELGFGDQYIFIEALVGDDGGVAVGDDDLRAVLTEFSATVAERVREWRAMLERAARPVVWGASSKTVGFMASVPGAGHAVDINPHKHGSYLAGSGVPVIGPADLGAIRPDLIVVMNPIYAAEIRVTLLDLGLSPELVAVA